jgi:DICT domain-containing protein
VGGVAVSAEVGGVHSSILTTCFINRNELYHFRIADPVNGDLSTAQLARRTGVTPGTLRMWESRFGFPAPPRQPGRHRRYRQRDVELVREVLRLRAEGFALGAAIERARAGAAASPTSLFAELRRRHPEIQPAALVKRALLRLSRAIEDEYRAQGSSGLLLASFQHERFYRQTERRWRELARGAALAVALADFAGLAEPAGGPIEVPIERGRPLADEWTLVVDSPSAHACLAAWEHVDQEGPADARRRFEVVWSFDPEVVRSSSRIAAELVRATAPAVANSIELSLPADPASPTAADLRFATALANRIVSYLAADEASDR